MTNDDANFRAALEASVLGIINDESLDSGPLFANQATADLLGYDSVENLLEVKRVADLIALHERERIRKYDLARLRGEGAPTLFQLEYQRNDGSFIWWEAAVNLVNWGGKRAIQATAVDISERKRAERALLESESNPTSTVSRRFEGCQVR